MKFKTISCLNQENMEPFFYLRLKSNDNDTTHLIYRNLKSYGIALWNSKRYFVWTKKILNRSLIWGSTLIMYLELKKYGITLDFYLSEAQNHLIPLFYLKYKIYGTVFSCILRSKLMEPLFNCHYFISHFDHFTP